MKANKRPDHERRAKRPERTQNDDTLAAAYKRHVSTTPLLDREDELKHASDLQDARARFAALVRTLPSATRQALIDDGDPGAPEDGWRIRELEACFGRMKELASSVEDPQLGRALVEARRLKAVIDRARDALIVSHLRFVIHVVKASNAYAVPFVDLVQEGTLGLLEAVERFEPNRGFRFATFAYWWIRKAISVAVAEKPTLVRVPPSVRKRVRNLGRIARELRHELGRAPSTLEIADQASMSLEKVEDCMQQVLHADVQSIRDEDDSLEFLRVVPDLNSPDPLKRAITRDLADRVVNTLDELGPQAARVIRLRFGIGCKERRTLEDIGEVMGLSRERVRQIERKALQRLHAMHEAGEGPGSRLAAPADLRLQARRAAHGGSVTPSGGRPSGFVQQI